MEETKDNIQNELDKKLLETIKQKSLTERDVIIEVTRPSKIDQAREIGLYFSVFFSALYIILITILLIYELYVGFPLEQLSIYLMFGVGGLGILAVGLIFSIRIAGDFFKVGLALGLKKGDLFLLFTKARKMVLSVQKPLGLNYFNPKNELSRFILTENPLLEPSTKSTVHTIREDSFTDFDVHKEYKVELEDMSKKVNTLLKQEFYSGAKWNVDNQNKLLMLVTIALLVSLVAAAGAIGFGYFNYDTQTKTAIQIDSNINSIISEQTKNTELIQQILDNQKNTLPPGVIVK